MSSISFRIRRGRWVQYRLNMSGTAKKFIGPRDKRDELSREERIALHRLRVEAYQHGARLSNNGRGGLRPSLALSVMRRDNYKCKACGNSNNELTLHHKRTSIVAWLGKHRNDPNNLVTVCTECHDRIHEKENENAEKR